MAPREKAMKDPVQNSRLQLAYDYVKYTGRNIYLTGKAGTGKTTFLHTLRESSPKRMVVVAPTGVAAINAGGVTIHSFFQMPFGPMIPETASGETALKAEGARRHYRFSKEKKKIIRSLDLLVIDEISMVRADLLDGVDAVLRRLRANNQPFGGVQLLMIGDLLQLPPVVKVADRELLKPYYETVFFFASRALKASNYVSIELTHVYRQSDRGFIDLLNQVRDNKVDTRMLDRLNNRYDSGFCENPPEGYITLTTHNDQARQINAERLDRLPGRELRFEAAVEGDFPTYTYPTDADLRLKPGAQVMFVKNDTSSEKQYYNGKIGRLTRIHEDTLIVECPDSEDAISVEMVEWRNFKYAIDPETNEIVETEIGKFTQFPLKPAWAITIHKSQGLTFDKAIIHAGSAFADGQVYVALSRCRTLEGVVLRTPIGREAVRSNEVVQAFHARIARNAPDSASLAAAKKEFQVFLLDELFDFTLLWRRLLFCVKICNTHSAILTSPASGFFSTMADEIKPAVITVAEKFALQRRRITENLVNLETDPYLQERVTKAVDYFDERIASLVDHFLQDVTIETDNQETKRMLSRAVEQLREAVVIKRHCLNACRSGIVFNEYLAARSQSIFVKAAPPKKAKSKKSVLPEAVDHPALFQKLKAWRLQKAEKSGKPAFHILHNTALAAIANQLPQSEEALRTIKGLKHKKTDAYGSEILEIVRQYGNEKQSSGHN